MAFPQLDPARFDLARFLAEDWQKRPALIRNPWTAWQNPLEPDELAGLACEDGIESRLIVRTAGGPVMENGPLPEDRFAALDGESWTILVQAVDQHVPDVAGLIEPFRFVPDWRIDDVMVSYATDGAGVGAHFDQYDVFLVQGLGRRRWRVGPRCGDDTPLLPHEDLRLIADFEASGDWVLEPGDILYVPPGFAHDGAAVGDDCMTYSIGFRAPSRAELVEGWCDHVAALLPEMDRYADPDLAPQAHPAEIAPAAIDRLHAMVLDALSDRAAFARWFAHHTTLPKYPDADWRPEAAPTEDAVRSALADGIPVARNPAHRFAILREEAGTLLYADGERFACPGTAAAAAETLCASTTTTLPPSAEVVTLVAALIAQGSLSFVDEDEEADWN